MSRSDAGPRDTDASAFEAIFAELIKSVPGAIGAALVDQDGETVDYSGKMDPYDLRVIAAYCCIVMAQLPPGSRMGQPQSISIRCDLRTFHFRRLYEGYALVIVQGAKGTFFLSSRVLDTFERAIFVEAGWPFPQGIRQWFPVDVACDSLGKPQALRLPSPSESVTESRECHLELLGRVVGGGGDDTAYRVRSPEGAEFTLVRDPAEQWYIDENLRPPPSSRGGS